ncbi:MAG TPA: hypothetical protein VFK06_25140 [Candidatus Angelobacter sp.]|nr:hypothetical protein [Candidatus Angelobacter sp.]
MDKTTQETVFKLRSLFPQEITVNVRRSEDGGFSAEILSYPNIFTEADTFSELMEMVNDALYTYFDVPEAHVSFMPTYLPPVNFMNDLLGFPVHAEEEKIRLAIFDREGSRG